MRVRALLPVAVVLAIAAPAGASEAVRCVDPERPECFATLAEALAAPGEFDRIRLGELTDSGGPWEIPAGVTLEGEAGAVLEGDLTVPAGAVLANLRLDGALDLAARASRLTVTGPVTLRGRAALVSSAVEGRVAAGPGAALLESVLVRVSASDGITAACGAAEDAQLTARHVTVTGELAGWGARAVCEEPGRSAAIALENSVVAGEFAHGAASESVTAAFSHLDLETDPGLQVDGTPATGSPLLDAGDPAPLALAEGLEDAGGLSRVADGDGDGAARRDIGAFERPAGPHPLAAGNLISNPGAETADPQAPSLPAAWSGTIVREPYGLFFTPTTRTALAAAAGDALFAGGTAPAATAAQTVDVSGSAPEIDAGGGEATFAALLGGYRADADAATARITFLDPRGVSLGTAAIGPVGPEQRGNAVNLLRRAVTAAVPPLTRRVEVVLTATHGGGAGTYNDAFADNVSLTLALAPLPGTEPPGPPPGPGTEPPGTPPGPVSPPPGAPKPFSGVTVLTPTAALDRRGRAPLRLACASATFRHCAGVLTLTTVPRPGKPARRIGAATFTLRPGALERVRIAVPRKWRRKLRGGKRLKVRLYAAARDGQGQSRATTSPLTLRRASARRR